MWVRGSTSSVKHRHKREGDERESAELPQAEALV